MANTLYTSVPSTEEVQVQQPRSLLNRFDSLGSWTNPFLSRFPSLATSVSSVRQSASSLVSACTPSQTIRNLSPAARPDNDTKPQKEEEEVVELQFSKPLSTNYDPFDDSHAVPIKPWWKRLMMASLVLAALIGLGIGVGLGVKKAMNKVEEIESNRMATSSLSTETTPSSTPSATSTSVTSSTSSMSTRTTALSTISSHSSLVSSTSLHSTSLSTSTHARDDVLWAVPKTL